MEINAANLRTLGITFSTRFQNGLKAADPMWQMAATVVPATTKTQEYGWLRDLPRVREWLGDRQLNNLASYNYTIKEKAWESSLEVDRDDMETDNLGLYSNRIAALGKAAGSAYDELLWPLLNNGWTNTCYDGKNFFATDHPKVDLNGAAATYVNTDGGGGTPWFLLAADSELKPLILQQRKPFEFASLVDINSDTVFMRKMFVYGVDARHNGGYGFPQTTWGSQQTLDTAHFNTAYAALQGMKGDYDRPLGFKKFTLLVPPSLRNAAANIVNADRGADGSTNINYKVADLQVIPWL